MHMRTCKPLCSARVRRNDAPLQGRRSLYRIIEKCSRMCGIRPTDEGKCHLLTDTYQGSVQAEPRRVAISTVSQRCTGVTVRKSIDIRRATRTMGSCCSAAFHLRPACRVFDFS
jgi:hypothetical protein